MEGTDELGPVDYLIVAFPGSEFKGEIGPALADLIEAGTIRIMDITFVAKDENGETAAVELMDMDPDVRAGLENLGIEVERPVQRGGPRGRGRGARAGLVGRAAGLGEPLGEAGRPVDARRRRRPVRLRAHPARGRAGRARLRPGQRLMKEKIRCH